VHSYHELLPLEGKKRGPGLQFWNLERTGETERKGVFFDAVCRKLKLLVIPEHHIGIRPTSETSEDIKEDKHLRTLDNDSGTVRPIKYAYSYA